MSSCRHVGLKNIKYTVAGCLGEKKKNMRLAGFSLHFARNRMPPCVANVHGNHDTSAYFILSRLSDHLIFRNSLSLFGAGILEKKKEHVSHVQHTIENFSACVNVHNSRTISYIAA